MKIVHVQLLPLLSGVQRVTLNEVENDIDNEHIIICSSEGPLTEKLKELHIQYFCVRELCREISIINDLKAIRKIYQILRMTNADIVHTHSSKTGVIGRIAAKIAGIKRVIHTVHGFSFPSAKSKRAYLLYYILEYIVKYFTDALIVLNEKDRRIACQKLHYAPKNVYLIPNGVDVSKFTPDKLCHKYSTKLLKVIMVGRLWVQKDPSTLLKAVIDLLERNINIELSFVGDGELRSVLILQADKYTNKINFLGWRNDIENILPEYDVFVLPSLWEGMPLAILEAMSCGLACVVTNIPGNNDLIKDKHNGYLFDCGDAKRLSELLEYYYNNRDVLIEHSNLNRQIVLDKYTLLKRNSLIKNVYVKN
ncbi:glycosyltransferase family 4 protein [Salmonella bongori]|uniref:glycosyltransferase family 4 protein n=1 Tax=Salmonella bongori TaxID=54736 RepID=UPI0009A9CBE1|nr:glycosyltransferase family 4 protein [Salmonella bongori]